MSAFAAVVLAAGASRRFGGAKLLAAFEDGSVLTASLRRVAATLVDPIVLVTGAHAMAVEAAAIAWSTASGVHERLRIVRAQDAAQGMGASLRAGVATLLDAQGRFTHAGVLVVLADMPCVPASLFAGLRAALAAGAEAAAPTWEGRRGHPVLFGPTLAPALMRATGDEGARRTLAALGPRLALVPAQTDGVIVDIDRPQDLEAVRLRSEWVATPAGRSSLQPPPARGEGSAPSGDDLRPDRGRHG